MKRYDLCIRGADIAGCAAMAEKLGWDGACFVLPAELFRKAEKPKAGIDVSLGVEVEVLKASDVAKSVSSYRRKAEVLAFRCRTAEMNRLVLETPEADMLLGAWNGGMNHVLAGLARENNVAVAFELQPLMFSRGRQRTDIFWRMLECAKFVRRAKAPFAISSGAQMPMDLRDPGVLASFGRLLGFDDASVKKAMSDAVILENRKRLSGKWVMPGVEVD